MIDEVCLELNLTFAMERSFRMCYLKFVCLLAAGSGTRVETGTQELFKVSLTEPFGLFLGVRTCQTHR